jgi:anti-sigma factor RsiW
MKCSDYVIWISRKLDGSLGEDETARLEAHLTRCGRCRAEAAFQKKLIHTLKQEIPGSLARDFTWQVTRKAEQIARVETKRRFRLVDLVPAALAAAAALVLVIFNSEVGAGLAPVTESIARTIGAPVAAFTEPVSNLLARGSVLSETSVSCPAIVARLGANIYFGLALSLATAAWAFSRAYTFMSR